MQGGLTDSVEKKGGDSSAETTPKKLDGGKAGQAGTPLRTADLARVPLILVDCGHTICQRCLCNRFEQVVINGEGSWDKVHRLSCNKCPECSTEIVNQDIFKKLNGVRSQDQARIIATVQACYPVNRALLDLRKTFVASEANLLPSPGFRKKRMMWPELELQEDENEPQIDLILDA